MAVGAPLLARSYLYLYIGYRNLTAYLVRRIPVISRSFSQAGFPLLFMNNCIYKAH